MSLKFKVWLIDDMGSFQIQNIKETISPNVFYNVTIRENTAVLVCK